MLVSLCQADKSFVLFLFYLVSLVIGEAYMLLWFTLTCPNEKHRRKHQDLSFGHLAVAGWNPAVAGHSP